MITILVRTSNRPTLFKRMFESVINQTFTDWRMIVSYDNHEANDYLINYLPHYYGRVRAYPVNPDKKFPMFYDLYCNDLKEQVTDGWFFFLDDDDFLVNKFALETISKRLVEDRGLICQFMRNRKPKPNKQLMDLKQIIRGKIGMPCLFLHAKYKNIADLDGQVAGDYRWIKEVSEKIPVDFVPIPVVVAGNNGMHGKMEN